MAAPARLLLLLKGQRMLLLLVMLMVLMAAMSIMAVMPVGVATAAA
jgi:hypothetical protein